MFERNRTCVLQITAGGFTTSYLTKYTLSTTIGFDSFISLPSFRAVLNHDHHACIQGFIAFSRLASLTLSLPDGCVRISLTTVVSRVARVFSLGGTDTLLKVASLVQLSGRRVDVATLRKGDVAVVAGA